MPQPDVQRFVGIDAGLTMCKAVSVAPDGTEEDVASAPTPRTVSTAGHDDIDADVLWQTVCAVTRRVTAAVAARGGQVVAVGVTGHGNGLYTVDAAGRQTGLAIGSTDTRAAALTARVPAADAAWLHRVTGSRPWAAQTPMLWRWVLDNDAARAARTHTLLLCKDWIRLRLTGAAATDETDASAAGLVGLATGRPGEELLDRYGLPPASLDLVPPIQAAARTAGVVTAQAAAATGLPAGVPVGTGAYDVVAALIGADVVAPGTMAVIVGTWGINAVLHPRPRQPDAARPPGVPLPAFTQLAPFTDRLLAMEATPAAAPNLDWLRAAFPAEDVGGDLIKAAGAAPAGAAGLVFLPFGHGSALDSRGAGTLVGLRSHHTSVHVARAVLEGVAHGNRARAESLRRSGIDITRCRILGGGARAGALAQVLTDVLEMPGELVAPAQPAARGAALLAGVAAGAVPDLAAAARLADVTRLAPDPAAVSAHRRTGRAFDASMRALAPVWPLFGD